MILLGGIDITWGEVILLVNDITGGGVILLRGSDITGGEKDRILGGVILPG